MNAALDAILKTRLLGIIRVNRYEYPAEVARALAAGGLKALEFTLSGEGALQYHQTLSSTPRRTTVCTRPAGASV